MAIRVQQWPTLPPTPPPAGTVRYTLPYPPSVNHYWRHVVIRGRVRVLVSAEGRRYRDAVRAALLLARARPAGGPLRVAIDAYPPDRRKRDADNFLKALMDSMAHGGAYADDAQARRLEVTMRRPSRPGRVEVTLYPWKEDDEP